MLWNKNIAQDWRIYDISLKANQGPNTLLSVLPAAAKTELTGATGGFVKSGKNRVVLKMAGDIELSYSDSGDGWAVAGGVEVSENIKGALTKIYITDTSGAPNAGTIKIYIS